MHAVYVDVSSVDKDIAKDEQSATLTDVTVQQWKACCQRKFRKETAVWMGVQVWVDSVVWIYGIYTEMR